MTDPISQRAWILHGAANQNTRPLRAVSSPFGRAAFDLSGEDGQLPRQSFSPSRRAAGGLSSEIGGVVKLPCTGSACMTRFPGTVPEKAGGF